MTDNLPKSASELLVHHHADSATGVHYITLNRPNVRNAISSALLSQLEQALDTVLNSCVASNPSISAYPAWRAKQTQLQSESIKHVHHSVNWPTRVSSVPLSLNSSFSSSINSDSLSSSESSPVLSANDSASLHSNISESTSIAMHETSTQVPARCLIIRSSSAKAFCSGADLLERRTMTDDQVVAFLSSFRRTLQKLTKLPIPTIAALDGPALGGGLELALACDFRFVPVRHCENNDKKQKQKPLLGFPECQLGIIPGAGGTQRAARLIGIARAKLMVFSARILTPSEALRWGLADCLSEDRPNWMQDNDVNASAIEQAEELARQFSYSAPLSLAAAKAAIDTGAELDFEKSLDWEAACYQALLQTQDRREALLAFSQKRKPLFSGR